MTIEDPSIPLNEFPSDGITTKSDGVLMEEPPVLPQKPYSLPNIFQRIASLTKRVSKSDKINSKQLNIEISYFLHHQRKRVHLYDDVNDILELERCTKDMKKSLSHIKFTPYVIKDFHDFYEAITDKEYELHYQKIFSNLDETLMVFAEDFMSRELRQEIHRVVYNSNDTIRIVDIFFFGKYPLSDRYLSRKFSKESYTPEGKKKLQKEIDKYLEKLRSKISELMEILECLKKRYIFPKKQLRAIERIEAVTSVIKRPIAMMKNLKNATDQPLKATEEKTMKTFNTTHKIDDRWILENLPKEEDLRNLLEDLT